MAQWRISVCILGNLEAEWRRIILSTKSEANMFYTSSRPARDMDIYMTLSQETNKKFFFKE